MEPEEVYHRTFARPTAESTTTILQGQRRIRAYQYASNGLRTVVVVQKFNQDFKRCATAFERVRSKLASNANTLEPVVDDGLTVVGHFGPVGGGALLIPKAVPQELIDQIASERRPAHGYVNKFLAEGVPVFVRGTGAEPTGWVSMGGMVRENLLTVYTSVDGEVLACHDSKVVAGAAATEFWPLDAVLLAKGVADLGVAVGRKVVKSLVRRALTRSAFNGPTGEVAALVLNRPLSWAARLFLGWKPSRAFIKESGMLEAHFAVFQDVARSMAAQGKHMVILVRDTNLASTRLISMHCPGKPLWMKFHTSPKTGVVTATAPGEFQLAYANAHYVVTDAARGIAIRPLVRNGIPVRKGGKPVFEELKIQNRFWALERGQVIDPKSLKPVVGDYDLMGVVLLKNPGQQAALVAKEAIPGVKGAVQVSDMSSPLVRDVQRTINGKLDMPRVLHSAQDQFGGYRGPATAFLPDGSAIRLKSEAEVKEFYNMLKRKTRDESWGRATGPVVDELAAARARKAANPR
jgi:hypothetical protein